MKKIILSFDGDAPPPQADFNGREQDNRQDGIFGVSNIFKLHLMLGGRLNTDGPAFHDTQVCRYYPLADPERIIDQALKDLDEEFHPGDELFLFGFGHGAAMARHFAAVMPSQLSHARAPNIRFMGLFDTVQSVDVPETDQQDPGIPALVFENQSLPEAVEEALHLLAVDDDRRDLMPSLLNQDPRVMEIWLPGTHEDIGGGHGGGLADLALQFMLDELIQRDLGLQLLVPSMIDYSGLKLARSMIDLDLLDMLMQPDHLGLLRQPAGSAKLSAHLRNGRLPEVYQNDRPSDEPPLIHHCVIDRLYDDRGYRPAGLRKRPHRVWLSDGAERGYSGLAEHLLQGVRPRQLLQPGESRKIRVHANRQYSRSGLYFIKGGEYFFSLDGSQTWNDGGVSCGAAGWDRNARSLEAFESYRELAEEEKRFPGARWFEVIGALGEHDGNLLKILDHQDAAHAFRAGVNAEFYAFPNDLQRTVYNSLGFITLTVQRIK